MSAVATMKPGGQHAVQQTFPYVFQQDFQAGTAYFPSVTHEPMHLLTGETFQSEYHRQKRNDAVQSVYNGLANDRAKEMKLLTGTANYHLPKPVLGQRIFANPSLGAGSDSSARRDGSVFSPWTIVQNMIPTIQTVADNLVQPEQLQGGVMKTQDGFDYYTRNLRARIDQLNGMNSIATGMPVPRGSTTRPPLIPTTEGPPDKVEFFLLLSTFESSLTEGNFDRFGFDDLKRLVRALFSFAPTATVEDFENMIPPIQNTLDVLQRGMIEVAEDWNTAYTQGPSFVETLTLYTQAMFEYVGQMFQNINLSVKDKELLSKGLQKEFGFTRLMRLKSSAQTIAAVRGTNERANQVAEDDDDDGGNGQFNQPAVAREDEDQDNRERAPFAGEAGDPNREIYGARRAQGTREQNFAYFGAEEADQPIMAQPLSSSGALGEGEGVDEGTSFSQYNMAALWAIDRAISRILPSTSSVKSRLDELNAAVEDGSIRSYDDFADLVVATATREADVTRDDVIRGLSYFDTDFPDVFSNFLAQNRPEAPVASVASEAPSSSSSSSSAPAPAESSSSSSSSSSTVTGRGSSPLPLGIRTRNELKALSEAKLREFGRLLPASYGGPYRARDDTKLKDQRLTLIKKIRQVKEDF